MKDKLYFILLFSVVAVSLFFLLQENTSLVNKKIGMFQALPADENRQDDMEKAMELEFLKTQDPSTHSIPSERLASASDYLEALRSFMQNRTNAFAWAERGPNNVGGRVRSILVDKNDGTGNTLFAGSVSGGIWKCTGFKTAGYTWTKVNDKMDNLAITALVQHPISTNIMYAGTGEGFFNIDAVRGGGIFKSTDGGVTWSALASTIPTTSFTDFDYVQDVIIKGGDTVYASTRSGSICYEGGIFRSTNAGTSWTRVIGTYGGSCASASDFRGADLENAANGDVYATTGFSSSSSLNYGRVWRSPNSLGTLQGNAGNWTNITPTPPAGDAGFRRIEMACAPENSAVLYALCQGVGINGIRRLYKSIDTGATWVTITPPSWCDQGSTGSDFTRNQAWYDLIVAFDPGATNNVLIGGVDVMKSTDTGKNYSQLTQWASGCASLPYVHADIHEIKFMNGSSSDLVIGCDGGLFYSSDGGSTFTAKNNGFNVTQYYATAIHPTSTNYFMAGSQDNGTHKLLTAGIGNGYSFAGGDGGFCHIGQKNPLVQISAYTRSFFRITRDGGNTFVLDGGFNYGRFINPTDYDENAGILYTGDDPDYLGKYTNIPSGTIGYDYNYISSALAGTQISAVKVDPNTANRVWIGGSGSGSPRIVRIDNANTASPSVSNFNIGAAGSLWYISNIDVEKGNANHLLVTFSNYGVSSVYESTNGGSTWTDIDGNLPDMPVRWGIFLPSGSAEGVIALATELGVFTTTVTSGGSTAWSSNSTGFPNVRTDMLKFRPYDNTLLAATHGRGLFTTTLSVTPITWTGATSNDWATASNWNPARMPTATDLVVIPTATANLPVSVTGTKSCFSLTIGTGASITVSGILQVAASLQNDGSVMGNGVLELNGTFNQTISGTGSITKLTLNNSNGATISSGAGNMHSVSAVLEIANGMMTTNSNLTLQSSISANSRIAAGAAAGGFISGDVTVERYIPAGRRAYRQLSGGVNSTANIRTNWQNGGVYTAGIGTHITGSTTGSDGFDATATGASSMFTYTPGAPNFTSVPTTNSTNLKALQGYRIFIIGDRNANLSILNNTGTGTPNIPLNNPTILRSSGTIISGTVTFTSTGVTANGSTDNSIFLGSGINQFSLIGNPYWSPVDFNVISRTNIGQNYWIWDPAIGNRGAYVSYNISSGPSSGNITKDIQPGQAIFVQNSGANPTLIFEESHKSTGFTSTFRPDNETPSKMRISLYENNSLAANGAMQDAVVVAFRDDFKKAIDLEDAVKFTNTDENIAIANGFSLLGIEGRPTVTDADTIPIRIWRLFGNSNYTLQLNGADFDAGISAVLVDKYLNRQHVLDMSGPKEIPFVFGTDSASFYDRFMVVFHSANPLPIGLVGIKAYEKEIGIQVDWSVENQGNDVAHYEVEKSTNGRTFDKMAIAQPKQNAGSLTSYNWFDANAVNGANYYRIKVVGKDGKVNYSNVAKVVKGKAVTEFTFYPNPIRVGEPLTVSFNNMEEGIYYLNFYNILGQKITGQIFSIGKDNISHSINIGIQQSGIYNMELVNEVKKKWINRLLIK